MTTRLYALGSNASGQLGIGHYEDVDVPTPCQFILCSSHDAEIQKLDSPNEVVNFKKSCEMKSPIRKIVAGGNHTMILCDNGTVYAAGNREALGEVVNLGARYPESDECRSQDLTPYFKRVMWWQNSQLLGTFMDISATWSASFFMVAPQIRNGYVVGNGEIYVCGKGEKGELGLGKGVVETTKPILMAMFGPNDNAIDGINVTPSILKGIWSSVAYTVICSPTETFGWGSCRKGQLGESVRAENVLWIPRKLADADVKHQSQLEWLLMAAVGKDFVLLQGHNGYKRDPVMNWRMLGGNNRFNGDGDDVKNFLAEFMIPLSVSEPSWREVSPFASWSNVYILDHRTQKVRAIGRDDHGQMPPEELPRVITMAAGSEHCVAVISHALAATWGWGEHGNCGKGDGTRHDWNLLRPPTSEGERISGVGAGCATTFIWTEKS